MRKEPTRGAPYHGRHLISALCLFTACLLLHALSSPSYANTKDGTGLLQFTSGGYVLGFSSGSMYLATGTHMLKVEFVGGRPVAPVSQEGPSSDKKAQPLNKVAYSNIWDGVDVVYEKSNSSVVKSTYTVSAGKSAASIRLRYNRPLSIDNKGNLVIRYDTGTMTESRPVAWQVVNGIRKTVQVAYNLQAEKDVGFTVSDYDRSLPLVIDPSLAWNTFLGGSYVSEGWAMALDSSGNIYVAGFSNGAWGSPLRAYTSGDDVSVAQLTADGALAWNTFLGGSGSDYGEAIALDSSGNIYVAGYSSAKWGSPVRAYTTGNDAFVAQLKGDGTLAWNTFLGGSGSDSGRGIALDTDGFIYVVGSSNVTWGSPVRAYTSEYDAFVAQLTADGTLAWNTFLGGSDWDVGAAIAVDSSRFVYVAGYSGATWGSPVRAYTSEYDAFAAKLMSDGTLAWNTFLGGSGNDYGPAIAVDTSGNVYVAGGSTATWGSPIRDYTSGTDAYAAQLNTADGTLAWNTFLGGSGNDMAYAIAMDSSGNIYVAGYSDATWGAPARAYTSNSDAFAAQLNTADGTLAWNTFLGGTSADYGYAIGLDSAENVYVAGTCWATWGSPVRAFAGQVDAYVAKVRSSDTAAYTLSVSKTGDGTGSVTGSPPGIDCGSTCLASFSSGTSVSLTAVAENDSIFTGWGGACSGTGACTVTISSDTAITASFVPATLTVTASVSGSHGSVSPATQSVAYGSSATITMTPDTGYHIAALTDNGESITTAVKSTTKKVVRKAASASSTASISNPYVMSNVTAGHAVVVTYAIDAYTLTATTSGSGAISATGLTCSENSCSGSYSYNTSVTITATPDSGSSFTGFTGCDSSSGSTCVVNMTSAKSVTAAFTSICTYTITPKEKSLTSGGGSTSVTVKAKGAKGCVSPDVSSNAHWITVSIASFKNNRGTIKVTASANDVITERTGTVTIGDNTFTATQAAGACSISISSLSGTVPSAGGTGSFTVTAPTDCAWIAEATPTAASWLSATPAIGSGAGSISYAASENYTGKEKSGKITVYLTDTPTKKKVFTVKEEK